MKKIVIFLLVTITSLSHAGIVITTFSAKGVMTLQDESRVEEAQIAALTGIPIGLALIFMGANHYSKKPGAGTVLIILNESLEMEHFEQYLLKRFSFLNDMSLVSEIAYEFSLQLERKPESKILKIPADTLDQILYRSDLDRNQRQLLLESLT